MSLVFHSPQSAGELLDVSLGVVKRHAGLLLRIGIWPTLAVAVKSLGLVLGLIFFLVPGALLIVRWFAVPAANVIEGTRVRHGFRRSRELARGNRRQIFITVGLLDVGMTVGALMLAIAAMDEVTNELPIWFTFFGSAFGLLYLIYHGVLSTALYATALYANARVRNEGYHVEDLLPVTTGAAG